MWWLFRTFHHNLCIFDVVLTELIRKNYAYVVKKRLLEYIESFFHNLIPLNNNGNML
jgi:hypothetical protein